MTHTEEVADNNDFMNIFKGSLISSKSLKTSEAGLINES